MNPFHALLELAGPTASEPLTISARVDEEAAHAGVPEDLLEYLGIHPRETREFQGRDGEAVRRPVGQARARLPEDAGDVSFHVPVVFLPRGEEPRLGASALVIFGLAVDRRNLRLVEAEDVRC